MKAARMRLLVAAVLFFAWIGWLAYLAVTTTIQPTIVLSRPQFLISNLDVIADLERIDDKATPVIVREVHWPRAEQAALKDKKIDVSGLQECRKDWHGPGRYILPLVHSGDKYFVAAIPPSPGFPPPRDQSQPDQPRIYRIYPVTPQTLQQLDSIPKVEP